MRIAEEKTLNRIKQYYMKNRVFIWGLLVVYVFHIGYLLNSTTNMPLMDYWTYIYEFTDKLFMGNISCSDIWTNFTAHRAPFQYICFFVNMKVFAGNTLVSVYLASLVTLITVIYIYNCYTRDFCYNNNIIIQIGAVLISTVLFSLNRWEIITLEFSFTFAVRVLLFVIIFDLIDKICHNNENCQKMRWEIGIFIFVTVIFFSSSYFPAMILTIAIIMISALLLAETENKIDFLKTCCIIAGFALLATIIYMYHLNTGTNMSQGDVLSIDFWMKMLRGLLLMMAGSLTHVNNFNDRCIYFGGMISLVYIVCFIIYYKKHLYRLTYLPIMLMLYSIASMIIISYARIGMFDVDYVSASRYTYETSMGIVGIIWICILAYAEENVSSSGKMFIRKKLLFVCIVLLISMSLFITERTERRMAVYRKSYMQTLQEIAYNVEEYSDDELVGFQANQPKYIREGIEKLKKYRLSIFKYY